MKKEDVLKIQNKINENQTKKIQIETKLETMYKTAKDDFDCANIGEIEDELDKMDKNMENLEEQIKDKSKVLSEAYDWGI